MKDSELAAEFMIWRTEKNVAQLKRGPAQLDRNAVKAKHLHDAQVLRYGLALTAAPTKRAIQRRMLFL
jgi:hypothetical protein